MRIIKIKDYYGNYQCVPVDDLIYEEWCKMRNEERNFKRRTTVHSFSTNSETLDIIQSNPCDDPVFDAFTQLEENIKLYEAIKKLTPIQRRRVYMLLDDMSYTDIAKAEGCAIPVVHKSIKKALYHLRLLMTE